MTGENPSWDSVLQLLGINLRIIRISDTYSLLMDPAYGRAVPNLIVQALERVDITIYKNGSFPRIVCYSGDTTAAMMAFIASGEGVPINNRNPK